MGADDARWLLTLPPESTVALRYTIAGSSRGDFGIGPFRFRGGDPLGLFPFDTRIDDRAEVLVLPARIDVDLRFVITSYSIHYTKLYDSPAVARYRQRDCRRERAEPFR